MRAVSFYELVRSYVTSWLNLLYTISLEARADENARTGPSPAPEKRVRAGELVGWQLPAETTLGAALHILSGHPTPSSSPERLASPAEPGLLSPGSQRWVLGAPARPAAGLAALSPPPCFMCPASDPQGEMRRGSWAMATPREWKPPDSSRGSATR